MPLLALFSRKSKSGSKVSTTGYSNSNVSLDDDEYVSVAAPSPVSYHSQLPASSSKLALPFRRKPEQTALGLQPGLLYSDPLLEPPPRRSSLFQHYQDDHTAYRSTQSLPDDAERRSVRPQAHPQQLKPSQITPSVKKSMFGWSSHKERGKAVPSAKPGSSAADDASFNLKSFRHVRPESPSLGSPGRSPSPSPTVPPIPTSTLPSPPVSFQVTSRRPRGNSVTELTTPSSPLTSSQQKMAAGAFRQAARRSATSLSLADSPVLSPIRTSLDDRPPPSLFLHSQATPGTPPRPPRPQPPSTASAYTPTSTTSQSSPNTAAVSTYSKPVTSPSAPKAKIAQNSAPRTRTNAFATSSSSSSSSEDEDEESDSDVGGGVPRISRRRTIKPGQGQGQARAATLPPLSSSVRDQIQRATPPAASTSVLEESLFPSATTDNVPRAQSSMGLYGAGTRPRASLSVGALNPTAKEARASIAIAANARLAGTAHTTPKAIPRPLARNSNSDTSESAESASESDEDAPLSSLVPPRRPGTSLSSHSAPSTLRKPLVDLDAPSTLTGRPVRAPPPLAREEEGRQRLKVDVQAGTRSRTSLAAGPQNARDSQAPFAQDSRLSQGTSSANSRASQTPSSRTITSIDTPTTPSFSGSSGRLSAMAPNGGGGGRLSSVGPKPNLSPVAPPTRPFARRESPASSTGDSSSGKAPLTPRDGSDTRSVYSGPSAMSGRGRPGAPGHGHGHGRKPSVTFEDEREGAGKGKQKDNASSDEAKRRERRRSEARAAIELGKVVNGPPPVDDDDMALGQQPPMMQGSWPQPGMQFPMQIGMPPVPPMFNMGMGMPSPGQYGYNFPPPSANADPAFLAAHQQAMAIAKQTFQYAVAQQALAAANDEWERSSTMTGFGGPGPAPQWSYGMGMRQNAMFTPAPRSMYAGSVGGGVGGGWGGTGSVYGDAFGPAAAGGRNSTYSQVDVSAGAQRPVRPRTKTAPSAASPPAGTPTGRMPAPPSSFRGTGR